ncbi:MAG TPA: P-II family nitrogen regulator [Methanomassiliicoccales archaeon]|jgi:nitrogen regulatory protein P-II 1
MSKKIEAIIRSEKLNPVKTALEQIGVLGITVYEVHGRGEQKGLEFTHRAGKYRVDLLPKTKIEIVVDDADCQKVVDALVASARTGDIGDGKIFISAVEKVIRIRTGEVTSK